MAGIEYRSDVKVPELDDGPGLLEALTRTIEAATRPYVKYDTGQTYKSSAFSDFSSGTITYSATDRKGRQYAGHAYEDDRVSEADKVNHPQATGHWFEKAEADLLDEWERFAAEYVTGGVG